MTPSFVFADRQAPSFGKLAGASHEVTKVLLAAVEGCLHRLGAAGAEFKKGASPMAQITASPEPETWQPVLLWSGDPEASRLLTGSKLT
jgi:hypothetical protein